MRIVHAQGCPILCDFGTKLTQFKKLTCDKNSIFTRKLFFITISHQLQNCSSNEENFKISNFLM